MRQLSRRAFLALVAGAVAAIAAPWRALGHHRPGHAGGPRPSPSPTTTPPPTTTTPPPTTTTTPPPPVGTFGPRPGVAAVKANAGHRTVLAPASGILFADAEELQSELDEF